MGERIIIRAIKLIRQDSATLMQIDLWFEDQGKGGRVFLNINDFFKMLCGFDCDSNENSGLNIADVSGSYLIATISTETIKSGSEYKCLLGNEKDVIIINNKGRKEHLSRHYFK